MVSTSIHLKSPEELFRESKKVGEKSIKKGISLVKEALQLARKQLKHELEFDLLLCIGKSCRFEGKGFESLEYCHKANRVLNRSFPNDTIRRSQLFREFGTIYSNCFQDHLTGLEYSLKSLRQENPDLTGILYNNIATTYTQLGQFDQALPFLLKAEKLLTSEENHFTSSYINATFAEYHLKTGEITKAIHSFKKGIDASIKAYKTNSNTHNIAYVHGHNILGLAGLYLKNEAYTKLTKQIENLYDLAAKFSLPGVQSKTMILEGKMYLALNEEVFFTTLFNQAVSYCKGRDMYDELDFWYKKMIELSESKNKFKEALSYSKALIANKEQKNAKTEKINLVAVLKEKESEILELEHQKRKIQAQRDQLEQIAYIVAHDLKTPLHNISHFISLFIRKLNYKLPKNIQHHLDFAVDNSKKMHAMLDELSIYYSIKKNGNLDQYANLNFLLADILNENEALILEKNASIAYNDLSTIRMHPSHLKIILNRMIQNSLKFANQKKPAKLFIEMTELPKEHQISISDNGIGIESKYHDQIFEPFKQLNKEQFGGIGVSLAICKKIINLYNGHISLESNKEEGVNFTFTIPK